MKLIKFYPAKYVISSIKVDNSRSTTLCDYVKQNLSQQLKVERTFARFRFYHKDSLTRDLGQPFHNVKLINNLR